MKKCCDDFCYIVDQCTVDETIYALKDRISTLSMDMYSELSGGFSCSRAKKQTISKLNTYKETLQRVWDAQYNKVKPCLCAEEIQCLIENAKDYINVACCESGRLDCTVDTSNEEEYVLNHPECQSYDTWNKWTKYWCGQIGMTIEVEEIACNIIFNVVKEIIPCNILFALEVREQMCEIDFTVNRTKEECKLDWKLLLEHTDCDLDFDVYMKLIDCNFSYDIIKSVIDAGCTLEVIGDDICDVNLCTITGKYSICDLKTKNIKSSEIFGEKITIQKENLTTDYKKIFGYNPK